MSKSRRNLDEDKKVKRVGKTVKQKLDKYPALIYNMYSSDNTDELQGVMAVSYTHLRVHEKDSYLVCRLLLEKKVNHFMMLN